MTNIEDSKQLPTCGIYICVFPEELKKKNRGGKQAPKTTIQENFPWEKKKIWKYILKAVFMNGEFKNLYNTDFREEDVFNQWEDHMIVASDSLTPLANPWTRVLSREMRVYWEKLKLTWRRMLGWPWGDSNFSVFQSWPDNWGLSSSVFWYSLLLRRKVLL